MVQNPGRVRRMTAAIVVNDRMMRQPSKGAAAQWQPWAANDLHNLTALAQAAVGFDATRGDVLTVEDLAFEDNAVPSAQSMPAQLLSTAENSPVLVKYIALLAGLLVVLAFGVRPSLKIARVALTAGTGLPAKGATRELADQKAAPALNPPEPASLPPERIRAQEILEQVSGQLKREPAQSSRLLQSWIHSD